MQAIDLTYDFYLLAFSGGKDSIASFLALLQAGVPLSKIELHHHDVDGREEGAGFMDWPSTPAYCRKFADAFGVKIYFSWREGGFLREMLRNDSPTARTIFETPEGTRTAGGKGPKNTRLQFPQVGADLSTRWCSSSLKIDVMRRLVANQPRFSGKRTLIISGERAQESTARAKYASFESNKSLSTQSRTVDNLRPVHAWTEAQVWDIIKAFKVNPAPAYRLGWGRLSCALCIFGGAGQWASAKRIFPDRVERIAAFERQFGKTIDRNKIAVEDKAASGIPHIQTANAELVAEAKDANWDGPIFVEDWQLPAGAFSGEACGPE
jgi:3'-phosphoadenosine 5'-phosphosulfate sulfotransferase (PAPS reductase)/FAD synthetase